MVCRRRFASMSDFDVDVDVVLHCPLLLPPELCVHVPDEGVGARAWVSALMMRKRSVIKCDFHNIMLAISTVCLRVQGTAVLRFIIICLCTLRVVMIIF